MSRLTFTPGNHTYWLADPVTGKKHRLPSVTGLLGMLDKPQLKRWAARTAADYAADHWDDLAQLTPSARARQIAAAPWQERDRAAASGTAIHALAEQLIAGQPVQVPEVIAAKVEAVARWMERNPITDPLTEVRVWTEDDDELGMSGYAGTADLMGLHPRYGLLLLDWKSGSGVYPSMADQLAAYAAADHIVINDVDTPMTRPDTLAVAHVTDGGVDLHVVDPDSRRIAESRFELLRALRTLGEPTLRLEVS